MSPMKQCTTQKKKKLFLRLSVYFDSVSKDWKGLYVILLAHLSKEIPLSFTKRNSFMHQNHKYKIQIA